MFHHDILLVLTELYILPSSDILSTKGILKYTHSAKDYAKQILKGSQEHIHIYSLKIEFPICTCWYLLLKVQPTAAASTHKFHYVQAMYKSICIILSVDCDSRPITIRHLISSPLSSQSVTLLLTITLPFSPFTNIHTDTQMHTHTHTCTHIYTLSYTDTHIYTLTHTHTITHTHMHTHTHTHAQIHTHTHQIINVSFLTMHFAENQRTPFKSNPV